MRIRDPLSCDLGVCGAGLVKQVTTVHSVLLCAALPPLGFLSHIFTCFFTRASRGGDNGSPAVWPAASPAAGQCSTPLCNVSKLNMFLMLTGMQSKPSRRYFHSYLRNSTVLTELLILCLSAIHIDNVPTRMSGSWTDTPVA